MLTLYVGFGLEKYLTYLTGFGLTLSVYDIFDLDLRNTQHNTGLELINQPSRDAVTKV